MADEEKTGGASGGAGGGGAGAGTGDAAEGELDGASWFAHLKSLGSDIEVEVAQLQRRYNQTFKMLSESPPSFEFAFHSSDPDFKFPLPGDFVTLVVTLPDGYPATPVQVAVAERSSLGAGPRRAIAAGTAKFAKANVGHKMLRPMLKWLDRNLEELLNIGVSLDARAAGHDSGGGGGAGGGAGGGSK
mmetsp:Transcript_6312/g.22474  ORF Transcript_6312/g.22474 Transcript_6312/m.22474 type:complete len:188 (-) Transcript_6312:3761-4324(-)